MSDLAASSEARLVISTSANAEQCFVGPKLFAVISETPEQAAEAVKAVVPAGDTVLATGGPLKSGTAERLELVPGEAKQIG